ncbi:MAG: tRNA (adenosine(37)-N6)-dimethylallyltransferase MiaA [Acidaminococcus sp.]|jgi:tRNA dimethylallyltransferase|nr:tRNA (adenosine(37)-N6)-dimethylallyltransferase MiaA [Acidaminococcus sp.]
MEKQKLIVIAGPTATGKTACGILLAQRLQGEIISGDSMLVFKGMDIATAKPTPEERAAVPHHLIDICEPGDKYTVVDFQQRAGALIREIHARGHLPIVVGGTGLYLKALLENYHFSDVQESQTLREKLSRYADTYGNAALHAKLAEKDPETAARLSVNDRRRVIRALESIEGGGTVSRDRDSQFPYDAFVFGLTMPREILYDRINRRVDLMMEAGLLKEAEHFYKAGISLDAQSMKSIGYRQAVMYFQGKYTLEECVDKIKQATRNFAKRQITWYKKMPYIHWLTLSAEPDYEACTQRMLTLLKESHFI